MFLYKIQRHRESYVKTIRTRFWLDFICLCCMLLVRHKTSKKSKKNNYFHNFLRVYLSRTCSGGNSHIQNIHRHPQKVKGMTEANQLCANTDVCNTILNKIVECFYIFQFIKFWIFFYFLTFSSSLVISLIFTPWQFRPEKTQPKPFSLTQCYYDNYSSVFKLVTQCKCCCIYQSFTKSLIVCSYQIYYKMLWVYH